MPAATRRWLAVRRRGQAAQELLLARDHVEPGSDKIVERFRLRLQNDHGCFDFGQGRRAERGVL